MTEPLQPEELEALEKVARTAVARNPLTNGYQLDLSYQATFDPPTVLRLIDQLKAKSGEASLLGEPPYSPITVRSGSLAPTPKTVSREEKGRAIYLAVYGPQGGWWETNETKDFWYDAADRFDALLATGTP